MKDFLELTIYLPDTISFVQYREWIVYTKETFGIKNEDIYLNIGDEEDDWDEEEDEKQFYPVPVNEV